jgi:Icc protein
MLIAQLSDTHVTHPGTKISGRVDTAGNLAAAVAHLCDLDPRPDAVVLTGDLTEHGDPAEYAHLRSLLAPLPMPMYAIPGNHDRRKAMHAAFPGASWLPRNDADAIRYAFDLGPLRMLALDTLVEGRDCGALDAAQLQWLDAELGAAATRPVVVLLHHPPVASGIQAMDTMKLAEPERLGAVIRRHGNVERILCGHLHRAMHLRWQGTTLSVCPSTAEQIHLQLRPNAPLATIAEPPAFQLHWWSGTDGLITHVVQLGNFPGPHPCF